MSSGAFMIPLAVVTGSALAVGAAGVAVLYAGEYATQRAADGLIRLDGLMAGQQDEQLAAQQCTEAWLLLTTEVAHRNARLRDLATALRDTVPDPPHPLDMTGHTMREIHAWCHDTDEKLAALEGELVTVRARQIRAQLREALPEREELVDDLTTWQPAALRTATAERTGAVSGSPPADATDRARALVATLAPGIEPDSYQRILRQAAAAVDAPTVISQRNQLDQLRSLVRRANAEAERRRDAVEFASRHLDLLRSKEFEDTFTPGERDDVDALDAVIAGERALDDGLTARVTALRERIRRLAEDRYLRDAVTDCLVDAGCEVSDDEAALMVSAEGWEHRIRLSIDGQSFRYATLCPDGAGEAAAAEACRRTDEVFLAAGNTLRLLGFTDSNWQLHTGPVEYEQRDDDVTCTDGPAHREMR